jgi:hypothetical protein
MEQVERERVGVLILRLWIEPEGDQIVRARITYRDDINSEITGSGSARGVEDACEKVCDWIRTFQLG